MATSSGDVGCGTGGRLREGGVRGVAPHPDPSQDTRGIRMHYSSRSGTPEGPVSGLRLGLVCRPQCLPPSALLTGSGLLVG